MKKIITVGGPIDPESCRMVLSHEHLIIDLRNQASPGASLVEEAASNRFRLMCDPYCMSDNLLVENFDAAVAECEELLKYGCDTVVDCSLTQIGRDPLKLKRLADVTGLNIVMGCGYYTADTHPEEIAELSVEAIANKLIDEIENGVADTGVKPGIIGEIGTSKEIQVGEYKVLQAAAIAQKQTGLAVQVHIYPWSSNGLIALKILTDGGVSPERIVICHSDVEPDRNYILQLLKAGVYVQLDNFGKEFTPAPGGFAGGRFVPDTERAELAAWIIGEGFGKQLLLSNDVCLKCMLISCGGQGYRHIFKNIVPLIVKLGVPEDYLKKIILRENPLRVLEVG